MYRYKKDKIDLTQQLFDIIVEHNIDEGYPDFRKYLKAREILIDYFSKFNSKDTILLIGYSQTDINAVIYDVFPYCDCNFKSIVYDFIINPDFNIEEKYEDIIIVSYNGYKETLRVLSSKSIRHHCLTDILLENNIYLNHEYYDYYQGIYTGWENATLWPIVNNRDFRNFIIHNEGFCNYKRYQNHYNRKLAALYLKKVIFNCLDIRDFVFALSYIDEFNNEFDNELHGLSKALSAYLVNIKTQLEQKQRDSILMLWVDALSYFNLENIPSISKLQGISISESFTDTPLTTAVFKSIFAEKSQVRDGCFRHFKINYNNSTFLQQALERGYDFVCFSITGNQKLFSSEFCFCTPPMLFHFTDTNFIMFSSIELLLNSPKKHILFLHSLFNTHEPGLSMDFRKDDPYHNFYNYDKNCKIPFSYINTVFDFWLPYFECLKLRFIFSDHGNGKLTNTALNNLALYRVFFKISGDNVPNITFTEKQYSHGASMFTKIFFDVNDGHYAIDKHLSAAPSLISGLDIYRKEYVIPIINTGIFLQVCGHVGVINKKWMLKKYNNGVVHLYGLSADNQRITHSEFSELMDMAGEYPIDYNKPDDIGECILNLFFNQLKGKRIAIRGGGTVADALIALLKKSEDFKSCEICCVIDNNPRCKCVKYGVPIVPYTVNIKADIVIIAMNDFVKAVDDEVYNCEKLWLKTHLENKGLLKNIQLFDSLDDFWKYTRYLKDTIKNYLIRNGEFEKRKEELIMQLLSKDRVAIMYCGESSFHLVMKKIPDYDNIKYIIVSDDFDINEFNYFDHYYICKMGIPHVRLCEFDENEVDIVIYADRTGSQKTFAKEVNLYEYLSANGIECPCEFWNYKFTEDDVPERFRDEVF